MSSRETFQCDDSAKHAVTTVKRVDLAAFFVVVRPRKFNDVFSRKPPLSLLVDIETLGEGKTYLTRANYYFSSLFTISYKSRANINIIGLQFFKQFSSY